MLRRAAVAGTWYPAAAAVLTREVHALLERAHTADALPAEADLMALVAPHAGLRYSGPVAAHAYAALRSRRFDAIVLVGPSHYVGFEGASIWPRGSFETPLGNIPVDEELAAVVQAACPLVEEYAAAHEREHSLEMQLPFLAICAPETPIVPVVMGYQTRETAFAVGDALAHAARGRRVAFVASSDLSHFYDAATATTLDAQVITQVDALDADGLMSLLERRPDHACGGGPMVSVLHAARVAGATTSHTLHYADSGDVSGDKASVVGYLAAAVWQ